jgi:hypothetical protein
VFTARYGLSKFRSEICALLGYYAASCDNCLPTFDVSGQRIGPIFTGKEPQKSADVINIATEASNQVQVRSISVFKVLSP